MNEATRPSSHDRQARLIALAAEVRPQLHRYCARLMGSVIDGEDVAQDTMLRALVALQDLDEIPPLRPWLFRVAHNRALDLLRGRAVRRAETIISPNSRGGMGPNRARNSSGLIPMARA